MASIGNEFVMAIILNKTQIEYNICTDRKNIMGEQTGEGYFKKTPTNEDIKDAYELLSGSAKDILRLKELIRTGRDILENQSDLDPAEKQALMDDIADKETLILQEKISRKEVHDLYDELYFEIYGKMPN